MSSAMKQKYLVRLGRLDGDLGVATITDVARPPRFMPFSIVPEFLTKQQQKRYERFGFINIKLSKRMISNFTKVN